MSENAEVKVAYDLWESFKDEILYKNRYFIDHPILGYIERFSVTNKRVIETGTILFRARLFDGELDAIKYLEDSQNVDGMNALELAYWKAKSYPKRDPDSGFWGYNKAESFIPSNNAIISDGRANPALIKYLYVAEDAYTAMVEVRPYLKSVVSIAEIKIDSPLTVMNFSYESLSKLKDTKEFLMYLIMRDFSKPANTDKKNYIPTQYIAEFIKHLGMDGIRFNSSLYGRGRNITIFNYENCEPISSSLYEIEDICLEALNVSRKDSPIFYTINSKKQSKKTFKISLINCKSKVQLISNYNAWRVPN